MGKYANLIWDVNKDVDKVVQIASKLIYTQAECDEVDLLEVYDAVCFVADKVIEFNDRYDPQVFKDVARCKMEIASRMREFEPQYLKYLLSLEFSNLDSHLKKNLENLREVFGEDPVLLKHCREYHRIPN